MDDEWGLSMEELDSLENNAKRQLAERQMSSSAASVPPSGFPFTGQYPQRPTSFSSPVKQIPPSPSKSSGRIPTILVKFFLDQPDRIGVHTIYNKHLVAGLKTVPGHEWDASRKIWTYPLNRYEQVISRITTIPEVSLDVEATPPLMLPSPVVQEIRQTGPNLLPHGSPLKAQRPTLSHFEGKEQAIPLSPTRLQVCSGNSQRSPLKLKGPALVVQIYQMDPDHVAARSLYNEKVKEACQSVPGRTWNSEERVWMVPTSKMDELVQALLKIPVVVEALPPLKISVSSSIRSDEQRVAPPDREIVPSSPQPMPQPVNLLFKCTVQLFLHSSGGIAAKFEYKAKLVGALRSIPRAEWNPRERVWIFPICSLSEAEKVLSSISDLVVKVEGLEPLVRRAIEATAAAPDLQGLNCLHIVGLLGSEPSTNGSGKYSEIPGQLESKLLQFQRDGVRFALHHGCRVLIADEMGLGKTLQAIAVVSCLESDWPVLIVVPSSLRLQWAASLRQWLDVRPIDITVVMSQCSGSNRDGFNVIHSAGRHPVKLDGLFNIVSYDLVTKLSQAIDDAHFKIIIADEAHYLKNAQAKRTNACVPLLQKAKYALLLTGTPALSRPIELFKQLEALQPMAYKNVHEYGNRYCLGGNFGMYQGSSNLQELHALVKSTVMIRRLKKDVLSELPQKRRQQVFVSLDDKGIRQMRALFNELEGIKNSIRHCLEDDFEKLKYAEKQILNKIYTESADAKLPAVEDYLTTIIETTKRFMWKERRGFSNGSGSPDILFAEWKEIRGKSIFSADCKFLIFAHHQSMLNGIEELLKKKKVGYIRIDGGTPQSSRQAMVTRFQESDSIRAAVLGIRSAGVGLTLTAASTVIFAEMSWTPGDLVQAEDRAHRIGQASSVNVYYLHAHDTIDDIIWDTVQSKLENLGQVLDGQENTLQVAATPKIHKTLPRGQGTLHSFLKASPVKRPCGGENSSAPEKAALTAGSALDPSSVEASICADSGDMPQQQGLMMNMNGDDEYYHIEDYLKRGLVDQYDSSCLSSGSKRKKLF